MFGPGDGPIEIYLLWTWTRRKIERKDSERYLPESGQKRKSAVNYKEYIEQDKSCHEYTTILPLVDQL